jgi:hypothetical protein
MGLILAEKSSRWDGLHPARDAAQDKFPPWEGDIKTTVRVE